MKFVASLTFIIAVSSAAFVKPAQASNTQALNGICENVAADNKSRFRKKLKESGLKLRDVYSAISCGGDNLVRYAMAKNANSVGSYIVKRMPASHFAGSGDTDWANSNGFGGSPIVASIAAR
jgi:hypothetical protein